MEVIHLLLWCALMTRSAAALVDEQNQSGSAIKHIVTFQRGVDIQAQRLRLQSLNLPKATRFAGVQTMYQTFPGLAGEFDDATLAELRNNPDVVAVEQDREIILLDSTEQLQQSTRRSLITQTKAPWNLGSISHRAKKAFTTYIYDSSAGAQTWGYVIDSGINYDHVEFGGRARRGYDVFGQDPDGDFDDHGTAVASIMCGTTYGVAKKCNLLSYRSFHKGSGSASGLLLAMDTAAQDILWRNRTDKAVVNISIGTDGYVAAIDSFAQECYEKGIVIVTAAGNSNANASTISPASAAGVITVAALGLDGNSPNWSNWGSVVDIYAPGVDILSATNASSTAARNVSGTSFAAPHVAGLALYLMAKENLKGRDAIANRIIELSTKKSVGNTRGSPNRKAYNGNGA